MCSQSTCFKLWLAIVGRHSFLFFKAGFMVSPLYQSGCFFPLNLSAVTFKAFCRALHLTSTLLSLPCGHDSSTLWLDSCWKFLILSEFPTIIYLSQLSLLGAAYRLNDVPLTLIWSSSQSVQHSAPLIAVASNSNPSDKELHSAVAFVWLQLLPGTLLMPLFMIHVFQSVASFTDRYDRTAPFAMHKTHVHWPTGSVMCI